MFYNLAVSCQTRVPMLPKDPHSRNCLQDNSRVLRATALIVELALIGLAVYAGISSGGISQPMVQAFVGAAGGILIFDIVAGMVRAIKKPQAVTHQQFVAELRRQNGVSTSDFDPKGLLYEISVRGQKVGYLFGALDGWDLGWQGLSQEVQEAIGSSSTVYMEYNGWQGEVPKPSAQWEVKDLAQGKKVHYLADVKLRANQTNLWWQACNVALPPEETILEAWCLGDEEALQNMAQSSYAHLKAGHARHLHRQAFTIISRDWFLGILYPALQSVRNKNESVFISVGFMSLFDVEKNDYGYGLKSRLTRLGYELKAVRQYNLPDLLI